MRANSIVIFLVLTLKALKEILAHKVKGILPLAGPTAIVICGRPVLVTISSSALVIEIHIVLLISKI